MIPLAPTSTPVGRASEHPGVQPAACRLQAAGCRLQAAGCSSVLVAVSDEEIDTAVDRILAAGTLYHNPTVHIRERPTLGPAGVPDHGLKIDVAAEHQVAALAYFGDPVDGQQGPWISWSPHPATTTPALYQDIDSATTFPPESAISVDSLRRALRQFRDFHGRRPDVITWHPATSW